MIGAGIPMQGAPSNLNRIVAALTVKELWASIHLFVVCVLFTAISRASEQLLCSKFDASHAASFVQSKCLLCSANCLHWILTIVSLNNMHFLHCPIRAPFHSLRTGARDIYLFSSLSFYCSFLADFKSCQHVNHTSIRALRSLCIPFPIFHRKGTSSTPSTGSAWMSEFFQQMKAHWSYQQHDFSFVGTHFTLRFEEVLVYAKVGYSQDQLKVNSST